jgi:hypothetical protein
MSKQEMASWPAPGGLPSGEGETAGAWSNNADETTRLSSVPPDWPGHDTTEVGGEDVAARGGPGGASGERGARPGPGQGLALTVGILLALAGPPFGFYLTRVALAFHLRPGQGSRELLARVWPLLLLTPGLLALASALAAVPAALAARLRRARTAGSSAVGPAPAEPSGEAAPAAPAEQGGGPTDYLLNQQEAFHYVDAIDDGAERALVEAALAHAISFLLLDDRYAAEFKATPMNLLTYARAVHAFAKAGAGHGLACSGAFERAARAPAGSS